MFGFLPGPCGCASRSDHSAWRSHFCGLCNTLRARYGLWSRWLINRDSTFLALTGSALALREPEATPATCCNPLGKKRPLVQHHPQMKFAAAVTICGLAVKLRDDAGDERGLRRHASRAGGWMLRRAEQKARADLAAAGFPVSTVAAIIGGQNAAESPGASLSAAAQPTAHTYGAIFGHMAGLSGVPAGTAALTDAGAALGRMIYTVDAWEDYDSDLRRRRFNPLPSSLSLRTEMVAEAVDQDLHRLNHSLTSLPLQRYGALLERVSGPLLRSRTLTRLGMNTPPPLPPEPETGPPPLPGDNPPGPNGDDRISSRSNGGRSGRKEKSSCGCCEWSCGCCDRCSRPARSRGTRKSSCCDPCCYCDCGACDCPGGGDSGCCDGCGGCDGCDCPCDCN